MRHKEREKEKSANGNKYAGYFESIQDNATCSAGSSAGHEQQQRVNKGE